MNKTNSSFDYKNELNFKLKHRKVQKSILSERLIACVASGSARVRRENWNESKKRNEFRAITRLETLATQAKRLSA